MNCRRQLDFGGRSAQRQVWWLAGMGLLAGLLVLHLVRTSATEFRAAKLHLGEVRTAVDDLSAELSAIAHQASVSFVENLSLGPTNTSPWTYQLDLTLTKAQRIGTAPEYVAGIRRVELLSRNLIDLHEQCLRWRRGAEDLQSASEVALQEVEDQLNALTGLLLSQAGRQRLRAAATVHRFRALDGTNALSAAHSIVTEFRVESELTDAVLELSELARFSGRLAHEDDPARMADLTDNLIEASLLRLRRRLVRSDPSETAQFMAHLEGIRASLLGPRSWENDAPTDRSIFELRQEIASSRARQQQLRLSVSDALQDLRTGLTALDETSDRLVNELTATTENHLERVWRRFALVGGLAGAVFVFLAFSVARTIRRQVSNLERHQAQLTLKSSQIEQARAIIAEERALLLAFVDNAPAAVAMFDREMRYLAASRQWLVDYHLEGCNLIGRSHYEVFPNIPQRWREVHQRCLNGSIERNDDDTYDVAGAERHLRWETRPWFDAQHRIAGLMIFTQDITEDRQREAELEKMRDAAQAASRAKSEFLAVMSHEIRTPMNGILGFTSLLQETALSAEQQQFVETIFDSGQALLKIINDILDFSKIEAGKLTVEAIPFNLCDLMERLSETLSREAEAKNLTLAVDYAIHAPRQIVSDPGRVRQIVVNLVGNAIKFTSRGHVLIRITPEPAPSASGERVAPGCVRIAVVDTGIGIPPEKRPLLFNKFSQTDSSTTRRYGGTGLGLAVSRQLAELMGGTIGVESQPDAGSTFWFTLPVEQGLDQPSAPSLPEDVACRRVLVVQPAEVNRLVLASQLGALKMNHSVVRDAASALVALREAARSSSPFDVVMVAPGDLPALLPAIKAQSSPALSVVVTASGHKWADLQSRKLGIFATCLVTPLVRTTHLITSLSAAVRSAGSSAHGSARGADTSHGTSAAPAPGGSLPAESGTASIRRTSRARYRVLVVEDNLTNQILAQKFLEDLQCQVDLAVNGREAVERVRAGQYDIVFMDCHMPELDGFDATEQIRKEEELRRGTGAGPLPIVAVSASAFEKDRLRAEHAGMNALVAKPMTKADLQKALETWVDRKPTVSP